MYNYEENSSKYTVEGLDKPYVEGMDVTVNEFITMMEKEIYGRTFTTREELEQMSTEELSLKVDKLERAYDISILGVE